MGFNSHHVLDISQLYKADEDSIGKTAQEFGMLWKLGILLPKGFVVTTKFYKDFLNQTGLDKEIKKTYASFHPSLSDSIKQFFLPIQNQIVRTHIPQKLASELHKFYRDLSGIFNKQNLRIISSSFDNKSTIFSNITGDADLILKIKKIWSKSMEKPIAIIVLEHLKSNVSGKIATNSSPADLKLTKIQIKQLEDYCKIIQKHFYFPKEVEYVVINGKLIITKISPFTGVINEISKSTDRGNQSGNSNRILIKGIPVNPGIATGPARIIKNKYDKLQTKKGEIIVLSNFDSSLSKNIKGAKGIVIDSSFLNNSEKALYRKAFQIPTVEGTKNATRSFQNGKIVTINGISGEIFSGGLIY